LKADSRGIAVPAKPVRKRTFVKDKKTDGVGLLLGYARVSKGDDQTNTLQTKALRTAGCRRLFEEAASGGRWDRPELHRLLELRPLIGDLHCGTAAGGEAPGVACNHLRR
jgi:Resolvase, N terminal domain